MIMNKNQKTKKKPVKWTREKRDYTKEWKNKWRKQKEKIQKQKKMINEAEGKKELKEKYMIVMRIIFFFCVCYKKTAENCPT